MWVLTGLSVDSRYFRRPGVNYSSKFDPLKTGEKIRAWRESNIKEEPAKAIQRGPLLGIQKIYPPKRLFSPDLRRFYINTKTSMHEISLTRRRPRYVIRIQRFQMAICEKSLCQEV